MQRGLIPACGNAGQLSLVLRKFLLRAQRERGNDSNEEDGRRQQPAAAAEEPALSDDEEEDEEIGGQQGQRAALARVQQLCEHLLRAKAAGKHICLIVSALARAHPGIQTSIAMLQCSGLPIRHRMLQMLSDEWCRAGGMHLVPLDQLLGLLQALGLLRAARPGQGHQPRRRGGCQCSQPAQA